MSTALKLVTPVTHLPQTKDSTPVQTRIYRETRAADRPIRRLMTWMLDRQTLDAAWQRVTHSDGANTPGIDGAICDDIRPKVADWLVHLADDLFHHRYRPQSPRWIEIPKPNKPGQIRRLGILTIRDRVVHTALKLVLETILEPTFLSSSFGFRPGRSVHGALADGCRHLSSRGEGIRRSIMPCLSISRTASTRSTMAY